MDSQWYPIIVSIIIYVLSIWACVKAAEIKGRSVFWGILMGVVFGPLGFVWLWLIPPKKALVKETAEKQILRRKRLRELTDPCPYCKWSIKEGKEKCDGCGKEF